MGRGRTLLGKRARREKEKAERLPDGIRRGRPRNNEGDSGSEYYEPDYNENGVDFMNEVIMNGLKQQTYKEMFKQRIQDGPKQKKDYEGMISNSVEEKTETKSTVKPKSKVKIVDPNVLSDEDEKFEFKSPPSQQAFKGDKLTQDDNLTFADIKKPVKIPSHQVKINPSILKSSVKTNPQKQVHFSNSVNTNNSKFSQVQFKSKFESDEKEKDLDPFKDRLKAQFGTIFEDNDSVSNCDNSESSSSQQSNVSSSSSSDNSKRKNGKKKGGNNSSQDKVTKDYKILIMKAGKSLNYSKDSKSISKDTVRHYISKAMGYYRLYMLIADCHIDLCPRQYEHDMKGKHLAKACECLKSALDLSNEFDKIIINEMQQKVTQLVQKQLIDKIEDSEFLCTLFEMIFSNIHKKLVRLTNFVGSELYSVYYKIASEIADCRGDLENAQRYLEQCKSISQTIGIQDNQIIELKLEEISKMKRRKAKERDVVEAKNCAQLGNIYAQGGKIKEAMEQYRLSLKICHDRDPETESICHFKLGRIILHNGHTQKDLDQAKSHFINFQVQAQMIKDKSESIQKKCLEAKQMLDQIQQIIKSRNPQSQQQQQQQSKESNGKCKVQENVKNGGEKKQQTFKKTWIQKFDYKKILVDLEDQAKKTIFEFLKFIKNTFKDKVGDIELVQKYVEPTKVRKQILKFIQIFHPDKQASEEQEFQSVAEEITKHLNAQLKFY
ncbi:UNKNOWN [Stylonychia lemnae]|uniref:Tpr domain containing protein n=1 Tax=Stylonychia lemnae TaxID=5949 RepID=A0A078ALB7_STYLE|nr:UNKNOWN [Stylonychia lemnae]|eukprot:CDW83155.1 UNKNOWN [Stylonychia lemnae]